MNENYKIEKIKKLINRTAYFSLFLDMCIAVVTSLSILKIGNPELLLAPINYMLTVVVILSLCLFITLFVRKHEESILGKLLNRRYRYKPKRRLLILRH
jgi:hypothetical protein